MYSAFHNTHCFIVTENHSVYNILISSCPVFTISKLELGNNIIFAMMQAIMLLRYIVNVTLYTHVHTF